MSTTSAIQNKNQKATQNTTKKSAITTATLSILLLSTFLTFSTFASPTICYEKAGKKNKNPPKKISKCEISKWEWGLDERYNNIKKIHCKNGYFLAVYVQTKKELADARQLETLLINSMGKTIHFEDLKKTSPNCLGDRYDVSRFSISN